MISDNIIFVKTPRLSVGISNKNLYEWNSLLLQGIFICSIVSCCLFISPREAKSETGTFLTGYGVKAAGMGGAEVALPQDAMVAVMNPAGMADVGTRYDIGSQFLVVHSKAEMQGSAFGAPDNTPGFPYTFSSTTAVVPIPEIGVNYQVDPDWTIGLSTWGAGFMLPFATPYLPPAVGGSMLNGTKKPSIGLVYVGVQPSISYKVRPDVAIGVSPILSLMKLNIGNIPNVPNSSNAWAVGEGARAGILWDITSKTKFGFSYASEINFNRMHGYKYTLLAAAGGRLNLPEQFDFGISYQVTPDLVVAIDLDRYNWSSVGFGAVYGYKDENAIKLGAAYNLTEDWVIRGGYQYAKRNTNSAQVSQQFLLPAILQQAGTIGVTYKLSDVSEISLSGEYDWAETAHYRGTGPSAGIILDTKYGFFGLEYGHKF